MNTKFEDAMHTGLNACVDTILTEVFFSDSDHAAFKTCMLRLYSYKLALNYMWAVADDKLTQNWIENPCPKFETLSDDDKYFLFDKLVRGIRKMAIQKLPGYTRRYLAAWSYANLEGYPPNTRKKVDLIESGQCDSLIGL